MTKRTNLGVTRGLAFILIYLFQLLGGIVFLITDRHDREIHFHALTSCYLCATEIIAVLLLNLLTKIPFIGWIFTAALWIVTVAYICIMLLSMIRALNNSRLKLPFYYDLADRRS